jgi:hypothetical protein
MSYPDIDGVQFLQQQKLRGADFRIFAQMKQPPSAANSYGPDPLSAGARTPSSEPICTTHNLLARFLLLSKVSHADPEPMPFSGSFYIGVGK